MLEITDLATSYGRIEALKGVSLQARAGEVTCLLGPNGAGKSTLMLTLAGLLKPQRGSVKLEGEELLGKTPAQIVARGMALVPENRLVFPSLTVKENLVAGAFKRRDAAGIRSDIDAIISTGGTGLTGRDVTIEAMRPLFEKEIDGFGTLFHMVSFPKIGTSTIQSRATAGVMKGKYVFCLPGSNGAVKDGWDKVIAAQLDSRHGPCNMVDLMPRLMER